MPPLTPEERALDCFRDPAILAVRERIARHIREAVKAETERCAALVRDKAETMRSLACMDEAVALENLAKRLRARAQPQEPDHA